MRTEYKNNVTVCVQNNSLHNKLILTQNSQTFTDFAVLCVPAHPDGMHKHSACRFCAFCVVCVRIGLFQLKFIAVCVQDEISHNKLILTQNSQTFTDFAVFCVPAHPDGVRKRSACRFCAFCVVCVRTEIFLLNFFVFCVQ